MREKKLNWKSLSEYYESCKFTWTIVGIFLLIVYGIKIFNVSISHDTEAIIAAPEFLYNSWYTMGRFGLIMIKHILGTYVFNPYVSSVLMVVVMFLDSFLWSYLFSCVGGKKWEDSSASWIFPVVFFTSVIMAEQSGFLLQSYEICIALFLLCIALLCLYKAILEKHRFCPLFYTVSIISGVISFSVYQSFVPLFATASAFCFLLLFDNEEVEKITWKFSMGIIIKLIAVFITTIIVYYVVNYCVLSYLHLQTTSYITDQIQWGKISLKEGLNNICSHIYRVMTGEGIFYTKGYVVACIGMVLCALRQVQVKRQCKLIYFLSVIFVLASPFMMTCLMGNEPTMRTQILLPFVTGVSLQYVIKVIRDKRMQMFKYVYMIAICLVSLFCLHQSMDAARLYYTQYVQYQEDVRVASNIGTRIEELQLGAVPDEPVVFVGSRTPLKNNSCYNDSELELVGRSFFGVSFSTMHGSWVMNHYMDTLGYPYKMPQQEDCDLADDISTDMPCWPDEGSVIEYRGIIIVKLG